MRLKKGSGLGDTIYDGAASFGVALAWISLIVGNLIGWGIIAFGIYLLVRKQKFAKSITARIVDTECNKTDTTYSCLLKLQYDIDSKTYDSTINTNSSIFYQKGTTINIRYNPDNPVEVSLFPNSKIFGWVCLVIGFIVVIGVFIHWYITIKYKFAAAATGFASGIDMVT